MIKAIFFDNDGVLVDTEHLYFLANQRVLATVGVELTEEQYHEYFLVEATGAWHLAAERGVSQQVIEKLRSQRNAEFNALLSGDSLVLPGVREMLEQLHGRYSMGIVTSSEPEPFGLVHRSSDLLRYFGFVLAQGDYPRSKPHPDPYLAAVERTGFRADECIVVEDSLRGLASARAAGLRCVIIPSRLTMHADFSGADAVLREVSELPDLLSTL